jgi:Domain of unknown function (DUF4388)
VKLEGSLDAFSLPDVFQLLSYTKKTGGLHLAHDGSDGVVFFSGGEITGASADGSRHPLARRLIGAGSVDDDALAAAVARVAEGEGVGLARALLEAGAVDPDVLRSAARDQAVDAVFDLLRWRDGDFAFVLDEPNPDDVDFAAPAAEVLGEAESRRDSWETVSRVVPSPDVVLSMPVVLSGDPTVSRDEWALLALIDGRRTVAELVDLAGCGQYAVVSALARLVERSLLTVSDAAGDHAGVVARRQALLAPLELTFVPVVAPPEPAAVTSEPHAPDVADDEPDVVEAVDGSAAAPAPEEPVDEMSGEPEPGPEPEPDASVADTHPESVEAAHPAEVDEPADESGTEDDASGDAVPTLGGAHVPGDVVPPRPEPFLPRRQADYDDEHEHAAAATAAEPARAAAVATARPGGPVPVQIGGGAGEVVGATAVAADPNAPIERDPSVNRSLMLRLIAGVRGL